MTLSQALALVRHKSGVGQQRKIFLACGFQPLHLPTLLKGYLAKRFPNEATEIQTGAYGDIEGSLAIAAGSNAEAAALVIEWSDLDPRLGLRSAGGWALSVQADIIENCRDRFARLLGGLEALAAKMPVALVPPTLPIPLMGHTAVGQSSLNELELQKLAATFLVNAALIGGVRVLNSSRLARFSAEPSRLDALMELKAGFPYTIPHASAVASQLVELMFPPSPMKGLITDLDETFWSGIVGELGVRGVSWSLADHTQIHGLYQQMLRHLSEMGVLLAIASKNELALVEEALRRDDLLVPASSFFPICATWGPKSRSVAEILRIWNIGADGVVFVDDSAMELDEVSTAFPTMTCLQFSRKQPAKVLELLEQLRNLFGKPEVHRDDALRQASIRANVALQSAAGESPSAEFVRNLQGRVTFDCRNDPSNKRLLELINKTNQFNLNGVRLSDGEWLKHLGDENALAIGVSYEDKFGPLGTIGVLAGRHVDDQFELTSWVLSCRAFSRKIEHHMLDFLFNQRHVTAVRLAFRRTDRNHPMQQCLASFDLGVEQDGEILLSRERLQNHVQELPHEVRMQDND
jgi:FkbH-like protein